jgi:hypothetical protein
VKIIASINCGRAESIACGGAAIWAINKFLNSDEMPVLLGGTWPNAAC